MRRFPTIAALLTIPLAGVGSVAAEPVPLPRERPAILGERFMSSPQVVMPESSALSLAPAPELHGLVYPAIVPGPSACEGRLGEVAAFAPLPTLIGPGACGARDVVRLEAILMPDRSRVKLDPPATLRCGMAEAVANWIRTDMGPAVAELGSPLLSLANYDSFDCRGRNRVVGAKLSEHGKANALDVRSLRLANGKTIEPTSALVAKDFRDAMRQSACARFKTVLGPGSDGYHEDHIHLDLAERSRGYAMCQWNVRTPPMLVSVPLPLPRPSASLDTATP